MPLVAGDQARGLITLIDMEREHAFSDSDVRLLQTLANSMSVALENARLFDETQRRTRETAALAEVGRDISSTLDLATVMDRIAQHAKDLLNADTSAIFLPRRRRRTTTARSWRSATSPRRCRRPRSNAGEGIIGSLVESGRAEYINDTNADPRGIQIAGTEQGGERAPDGRAAARRQKVKGVMAVWRTGGEPFSDSDLEFLVGLSLQATVAIENARLFAESRAARGRARHDQHGVAAARRQARAGPAARPGRRADPHGVQRRHRLRRAVQPATPASSTSPTSTATTSSRIKFGEGLTSRIIQSGKALIINHEADRRGLELGAKVVGKQALSYLGVPIPVGGTSLGVISVQSTQKEGVYGADDERLLSTIAANVGVALQNARLFNETQEALAHQTATADILRVISSSPTDVQPVFDAIVGTALKLMACDFTARAAVRRKHLFHGRGGHAGRRSDRPGRDAPCPSNPAENFPSRVILSKAILHIPEWTAIDIPPHERRVHELTGVNSSLMLPLHAQGRVHRRAGARARQGRRVQRQGNRARQVVRRPGRDRHRERAPVQRDEGGARAADGDRRSAEGHQRIADRRAAGVRHHRRARGDALPAPITAWSSASTAN